MNRKDLQQLANMRIREARVLLDSGNFSGAYYLAGYTIECALKSCISKQIHNTLIPDRNFCQDFYQHDLQKLIRRAGLIERLESKIKVDEEFSSNWALVKDWNEQSRYHTSTHIEAKELYKAIVSTKGGVLQWIRNYW